MIRCGSQNEPCSTYALTSGGVLFLLKDGLRAKMSGRHQGCFIEMYRKFLVPGLVGFAVLVGLWQVLPFLKHEENALTGAPAPVAASPEEDYAAGMTALKEARDLEGIEAAIDGFKRAAAGGHEPSKYELGKLYLFGAGALKPHVELGARLNDELLLQGSKFGAQLSFDRYDNLNPWPVNTRAAMLLAVKAATIGKPDAAALILSRKIGYESLSLPPVLEVAWLQRAIPLEFDESERARDQEVLDKKNARLTSEERAQVETLGEVTLAHETLKFLTQREQALGPLEPADLVNEGWHQFTGERGEINEPLAQYLTEEALRVAIIAKDRYVENLARNNLGVILCNAVNPLVRNPRLADVHLMDAYQSDYAPDNLLMDAYLGGFPLDSKKLKDLRDRFFKDNGRRHVTERLPPLRRSVLKDPRSILKVLIDYTERSHDPDGADAVISFIEDHPESFSISDAEPWYQKFAALSGKSPESNERYVRLQHIMKGQYVKDYPNLTDAIPSLFRLKDREGTEVTTALHAIQRPKVLQALVIGNQHYSSSQLQNPLADSSATGEQLKHMGFEVTLIQDASREDLVKALLDFASKAKDADVTVLYYSGHGAQVGGVNYLLPTDIDFKESADSIVLSGVSLNEMLMRHIPGKTRIVFLDACRNSPFRTAHVRSGPEGLAPINVPKGTLISFATRDGGITLDGQHEAHSPYTGALLSHLEDPEDVALMLRHVRDEVYERSKGAQEPWEYGALSGGQLILSKLSEGHP